MNEWGREIIGNRLNGKHQNKQVTGGRTGEWMSGCVRSRRRGGRWVGRAALP